MDGAFNDVAVGLAAGAVEANVIGRLDDVLERVGVEVNVKFGTA